MIRVLASLRSLCVVLAAFAVVCLSSPGVVDAEIVYKGDVGVSAPPATCGPYEMTKFPLDPRPLYEDVFDVPSPLGGELLFDIPMSHRRIGAGWATWSHGYTGDIYFTNYLSEVTLAMPPNTVAFYFYVEPNSGYRTFEATAQDGTSSGEVDIYWSYDAHYFGFYATEGDRIETIHVEDLVASGGFCVGEFGIARCDCTVPPAPPAGVAATDGAYLDKVVIEWSFDCCANEYRVYRNTQDQPEGAVPISDWLTDLSFGDTTMEPGVEYWYWVRLRSDEAESAWSEPDTGFAYAGVPPAPTAVDASDGSYGGKVVVTCEGSVLAEEYRLCRNLEPDVEGAEPIGDWQAETVLEDPTAELEVVYWYWVLARNGYGESPFSEPDDGYSYRARFYVDAAAPAGGDGWTWGSAFRHLQDALAVARPAVEIWISEGVHLPDHSAGHPWGTGDRGSTFDLVGGVELYGGFPAGGGTWEERRPWLYETILSGDLHGDDGPDFEKTYNNSCHVLTLDDPEGLTVLDGLTITGGNADEACPKEYGGGLLCLHGDTLFTNCVIRRNSASFYGGGVFFQLSEVTFVNCALLGNRAGYGGAMRPSAASLANCTVVGNSATVHGGGIYATVVGTQVDAANCIVWGNVDAGGTDESAQYYGKKPTMNYCCLQGWSGDLGGVGNHGQDPLFVDADGVDDIAGTADDDLRLSGGSPCIDAADNTAVPADAGDLDGDGDTAERVPLDLAGSLRFWDDPATADTGVADPPDYPVVVDMGAYELYADCNTNGLPDPCDLDCGEPGGPCDLPGCGGSDDYDSDLTPDECQDCNANGVADACDLDCAVADCASHPSGCGTAEDCNSNGIPDECDVTDGTSDDYDASGAPDECEDCNTNGVADACDIDCSVGDCAADPDGCGESADCNTNGVPDECDLADGTSQDCQPNGVPDECDLADGTSADCNSNGIPDECDLADGASEDCNTNGIPDECDVAEGTSADCNTNGVPDECDLADGTSQDCQPNGVPDECDIAEGVSEDYDLDGVPDECQDCNSNGVADTCDVDCSAGDCAVHPGGCGESDDYDGNGVPDECEDCNENGVADACDLDCATGDCAGHPGGCGQSDDYDGNGVPDECEDCNGNGVADGCDLDCEAGDCAGHPGGCGDSEDCNSNGVPDECDIADGGSEDLNTNGLPDECEPWIVAARSCRLHGAAGTLCLDLALEGEATIEPRISGIERLEFDLRVPVDGASVTADHVQVACVLHGDIEPASVSPAGDSSIRVKVNLPDADCCRVTLDGVVSLAAGYPVPNGCSMAVLEGDVTQDGIVNSIDASAIKPWFGMPADVGSFVADVLLDGLISTLDVASVKPRFGHTAPDCP